MKKKTIIILAVIMIFTFLLRVLPYISKVFMDGYVNFYDPDANYHLRLVEYMVNNFPHFLTFDPYAIYPDGGVVGYRPVLTFITSGIALLLGGGHPSQHLIEVIAAWIPPIAGTLLVIPVYFLGKYAFSRTAGIVGAVMVAVMPTELFARSMLGAFDHHILEVLFGVCTILFLVMAYKKDKWWLAIIAGGFLGLYVWNWTGGMFLAAIIFLWYLVSVYIGDSRPGHVFLCFATAFLCVIPILSFSTTKFEWALVPMALTPVYFNICHKLAIRDKVPYKLYLAIITLLLAYVFFNIATLSPSILVNLKSQFMAIFWGFGSTIMEAQPSSLYVIIYQFGIVALLAGIGFLVAYKDKVNPLVLVWSVVLVLAMIGQRRWGYYATIPLALLGGYTISRILDNTGKLYKSAVWVVCAILLIGSLTPGFNSQLRNGPSQYTSWVKAYTWIRDNTPDPMNNPQDYYKPNPDKKVEYGVLSWWDYGHWCIYYAHRAPLSSNTFQISGSVGKFLLSQNLEMSEIAIKDLNVKYVVLSADMVKPTGTFYAIYQQIMGTMDGWEKALPGSMAYNLYTRDELGPWKFVYSVDDIRIYERVN